MARFIWLVALLFLLASPASAQVVMIQGSDTVSASRTTINNNFTYLQNQVSGKANLSHVHLNTDLSNWATAISAHADVAANTASRHSPFTVGTRLVDEAAIADGKALVWSATAGKLIYGTVSGEGGTADGVGVDSTLNWTASDRFVVTDGSGGKLVKQIPLYWDGVLNKFVVPGTQQLGASGATYRAALALYGHTSDTAQPPYIKFYGSGTSASLFVCSGNRLCANQGSADPATSTDYLLSKSDYGTVSGLSNSNATGSAGTYARSDHQHKRDGRIKFGTSDFTRNALRFSQGSNIVLTVTDDPTADEVVVAVSSTASGGTGTVTPNYTQSFSNATQVTLAHGLGSSSVIVACYDTSGAEVLPDTKVVNAASPYVVTVGFTVAQSGKCVVNAGSGGIPESGVAGVDTSVEWTADSRLVVTDGASGKLIEQTGMIWDSANNRLRLPGELWLMDSNTTDGLLWSMGSLGRLTRSGINLYGGDVTAEMSFLRLYGGGTSPVAASLIPCSGNNLCINQGSADPVADSTNYILRKSDVVQVQNNGTTVNSTGRSKIDFVPGTNVSVNAVDDSANDRVRVTISASGGTSGGSTLVSAQPATSAITLTSSLQDVYAVTVPGGTFGANQCIEVRANISITNSLNTKSVYIKYGTQSQKLTDIYNNEVPVFFDAMICNKSTTNTQNYWLTMPVWKGTGHDWATAYNPSWAIDSTVNQTLSVQASCASCSTETITGRGFIVTVIK